MTGNRQIVKLFTIWIAASIVVVGMNRFF